MGSIRAGTDDETSAAWIDNSSKDIFLQFIILAFQMGKINWQSTGIIHLLDLKLQLFACPRLLVCLRLGHNVNRKEPSAKRLLVSDMLCYNTSILDINYLSYYAVTYRGKSAAVTTVSKHKRTDCPFVNLNFISSPAGMFNSSLHVLSDPAWEILGN